MGQLNSEFTKHELEILKWLALGKSDLIIADILAVSPKNIKTHIAHLLKKMGARDRIEVGVKAIQLGI